MRPMRSNHQTIMTAQQVYDTAEAQKARAKAVRAELEPMLSRAWEQFREGRKALRRGFPGASRVFLDFASDTLTAALKQFPKE